MAGKIQGITIEIAGKTSGLVSSLKEADKALSQTQSALKQVNKALELDPGNTDLLGQKFELLTNAVSETEDRLKALKETAALAAKGLEDGTVSKEQYAQLTAEIALTEANLAKLKDEASGAGENLKDVGEGAEESSENLDKASVSMEGFGKAAEAAAAVAAAAVAAMAAAFVDATAALANCTVEAAAFADDVMTTSTVTGIATDKLQELMYSAELVDVSVDTMSSSITKNVKSMNSAAEGTGAAAEAYEKLGISVTNSDGSLRDQQEVYWEVIDALGQVENETERDALAMDLLGKSAMELNPLIEAGSERMKELGEEAHDAGYVMSDDALEAFGAFDDEIQRLKTGTTAAKNALGTVLLPTLTQLGGQGVDLLNQFTNAILDTNGDVTKMGEVIDEMLPQVIDSVLMYLPDLVDLAMSLIGSVGSAIISNLDPILEAATSVILALIDGLVAALPELLPPTIQAILTIAGALMSHLDEILTAALQVILALGQGLADNTEKLIPTVVDIVLNIVEFFIDNIDEFIILALDIMVALASGLVEAIPEIVGRIPEIIGAIIEAFADLGVQLWENAGTWGLDLIDGFCEGIRNGWNTLTSTLSDFADTVVDFIGFSEPDKGPLSKFHTFAPDMIDLFTEGITQNLPQLANTMTVMGNVVANGADYSGQLNSINGGIQKIAAAGSGQIVIPISIGEEQIDTIIVNSNDRTAYLSGGR